MTNPDQNKKSVNNIAKYSSISFQMLAIIGLFTFAGYKIDEGRNDKTPVFTTILSLAGVVISLYQVIKQLNKKEK